MSWMVEKLRKAEVPETSDSTPRVEGTISDPGIQEKRFPQPGSVIHLIGVGGAGMSAIARILASLGYRVTGSDLRESTVITRLRSIGVTCAIGHDPSNIASPDAVIYSAAVRPSNPELQEAYRKGIPTFKRTDAVAHISEMKRTISVGGTHGKTSTSSMLALVLSEAGLDPSFMVGAELNEAGTNARWGSGEWQVLEADESDGTFLKLKTEIAVVTNVDRDHLENWAGSFDRLKEAFAEFMTKARSVVVLNRSDPVAVEVCQSIKALESAEEALGLKDAQIVDSNGGTFVPRFVFFGEGEGPGISVRTLEVSEEGTLAEFCISKSQKPDKLRLPLIGRHFAVNAAAVVAVATELGIEFKIVRRALEAFEGVERRMVWRGEASGVAFYDDYAHTPAEVRATLEAARELALARRGRVVAVFQPHLYTRTARYCSDFASALSAADLAFVTEVYGSREDPIPGVTGRLVADEARTISAVLRVQYVPSRRQLVEAVTREVQMGDVVVTMGAGDVTASVPIMLDSVRKHSRSHSAKGRE
ncbi:MAG: UDP-N-acetylmuramate--L-alanine ligase [Acidimicrobiia bacterium]